MLILSATRHIHEPVTNLIHKAKNTTNDVLRAVSIGISTSTIHATQELLEVVTATMIPPSLEELEPTQTPGLDYHHSDDIPTVELVEPSPPSTVHNIPNVCVSQAAPSPEQHSTLASLAEMCGLEIIDPGSLENDRIVLRKDNQTCLPEDIEEKEEISDVEDGEGDVDHLNISNHTTVAYRTVDPFIQAMSMLRDHVLKSSYLTLTPFLDHESLAEIIHLLVSFFSSNERFGN